MVSGKIADDEAEKLLDALGKPETIQDSADSITATKIPNSYTLKLRIF